MRQLQPDPDIDQSAASPNVVIVNPTAGRGEAGKQVPRIRRCLGPIADQWIWHFTRGPGDAEHRASEAAAAGAELIVAVGGDGTLHEVANGIIGSTSTLGLIPFGTGNDLARALSIHGNVDVACRAILDGETIDLDVGVIDGNGTGGERHFLVIAGTGFDARTAQTVNNGVRWLAGAAAYVYGALTTLAAFKPFQLALTLDDGEQIQRPAMFCSVANASTTGGGMKIAPEARVDDGRFDICLAGEVSKLTLVHQLTKVFKGEHVHHTAVSMHKASSITLDADPPQPLLIDGEVVGMTPATIKMLPGALPIKVGPGFVRSLPSLPASSGKNR